MIFENLLLNDKYVDGESTLWPVYWRKETDFDGSGILVPYVVIHEDSSIGEKRREDIRRRKRFSSFDADTHKGLHPMLCICRETRTMALDPAKGRYASLPVLWTTDCYYITVDNFMFTDELVLVHPHRDVFLFSDPYDSHSWLDSYQIALNDGTALSIREIAQFFHNEDLPYNVDMELLRAAALRAGFRFRHVLFIDHFIDSRFERSVIPWVLVHICENTDPRAHLFFVFLPFHVDSLEEYDIVAGPFVRLFRRLKLFPLGPPPPQPWEIHEQDDCQCYEWHEREDIFDDRPRIFEILDFMREAGMDNELNQQD